MKAILGLAWALAVLATGNTWAADTAPASETKSSAVETSVVKVFSTVRYPDYYRPWTKQSPTEMTGSGVVINGKRILTCAHVVLYASQIQIQANQAGDKLSASVAAIAPGIDLAVLKLDDEAFFDTHPAVECASTLPDVKDTVMAYGYPTGGTTLSITKGIVSRIEFAPYNYPTSGLRIQIDAAINRGNSGGPAINGEKMIGLAFSRLGGGTENIGYIVPCEEIELFLHDIADGRYDGKPAMFDECQGLENAALRSYLKLDKSVEGMVVRQPDSSSPEYPLKEWDVITRLGDTPVDNQGMIKLGRNLRVNCTYLVQKIVKHGRVPLTVVRAGKTCVVELPVSPDRPVVIPYSKGAYPSYFVYGPLVFTAVTAELVGGFTQSSQWNHALTGMGNPMIRRWGDKPSFEHEGLVAVSSPFFPHKLAKGYSVPTGRVVKSVNGTPIKNLGHLVEVFRDAKDEFLCIVFDGRNTETLVFPRTEMLAATDEILSDNGVRDQGSPDTLAIWNNKPAK